MTDWRVFHVGERPADGAQCQYEESDGTRCLEPAVSRTALPGKGETQDLCSGHDGRCQYLSSRGRCPAGAVGLVKLPGQPRAVNLCAQHRRSVLDPLHVAEGGPGSAAWEGIRARIRRRRGGRAKKYNEQLQQRTDALVAANDSATFGDVWGMIPKAREAGDALIYRDGGKVVVVDDRTGAETVISRRSFERYVTRARRQG